MRIAGTDNSTPARAGSISTAIAAPSMGAGSPKAPARDFSSLLAKSNPDLQHAGPVTKAEMQQTMRRSAEQLVASNFILPMLSELREESAKNPYFHGGRGEQAFGQQLDTILADRIVQKANLPIVEVIYKRLAKQANLADASTPAVAGGINTRG